MARGGWIKLSRQICEHWLWEEKPFSKGQAWIDLLLLANYKDADELYKGRVVVRNQCEIGCSAPWLGQRWGWSADKVRWFLDRLVEDKMISYKSSRQGLIVRVLNYKKWQVDQPNTQHNTEHHTQLDTQPIENSMKTENQPNTQPNTQHNTEHEYKRSNKNYKEKVVETEVNKSKFLHELLSEDEWEKLNNQYHNTHLLIDYVDNMVNDTTKIKDPFRYIVAIAEKKNWERKQI